MKTLKNSKRFCFAVLSTLFLCCNMTRAASIFDPLANHKPSKAIRPLGSWPCEWPEPPGDPSPGDPSPDCIIPVNCVCESKET